MLNSLKHELTLLSNKAKYIIDTLNGKIDLRRKNQHEVNTLLKENNYDQINNEYKYLTKMPMDSVTNENVEILLKSKDSKTNEYNTLLSTTPLQLWSRDIESLEEAYDNYLTQIQLESQPNNPKSSKSKSKIKK